MRIVKLIMVLAISVTYSCQNQAKEQYNHDQAEKTEKSDEHQHSDNNGLVLDDGKLWVANPESTTGVENMVNIMNSFTEKDNVEAYKNLTESLRTEFTMIFQKCTMTGEAHNQLHNFLIPIRDTFETLSSTDLKQCQESFDKLADHLKEYKKYFE